VEWFCQGKTLRVICLIAVVSTTNVVERTPTYAVGCRLLVAWVMERPRRFKTLNPEVRNVNDWLVAVVFVTDTFLKTQQFEYQTKVERQTHSWDVFSSLFKCKLSWRGTWQKRFPRLKNYFPYFSDGPVTIYRLTWRNVLEHVKRYQKHQENLKSCDLSADQHSVLTPTASTEFSVLHVISGLACSRFIPELPKYEFGKLQFRF
jgi:hypothetical protein